MRLVRFSPVCLAAALLVGCGGKGQVYDRPPEQVRDLLRTVEIPLYVFGSSAETDSSVDASDPAKMVWKITANGSNLMKVIASIPPEGTTKTRVDVEIEGASGGKYGDVEAGLKTAPGVKNIYLVTMREPVDSTLDGRRFDITATYPAMMSATMVNANKLSPQTHPAQR